MARDNQWGQRNWRSDEGRSNRWRDENEGRYGSADEDRDREYDYRYTREDEGDSSVRAGSYDQGRVQYGRRERGEPGSSGDRFSGYGDFGRGDYGSRRGGQSDPGRYGQTRYGGGNDRGNYSGDYGYGRQGGYGGGFGQGRYGEGGSRSRFEMDRPGEGRERYADAAGYGGSSGTNAWRGYGAAGDYSRGWDDPYGEGQQYSPGAHAGERPGMRGAGPHRGKGPRSYQRSDERLREMICERLSEDPDIDASDITVNVKDGRVALDGTVDSRQSKNLAEDVAEQFAGDVQNNLRVQRQDLAGMPSAAPGSQARGSGATEQSKSKQH